MDQGRDNPPSSFPAPLASVEFRPQPHGSGADWQVGTRSHDPSRAIHCDSSHHAEAARVVFEGRGEPLAGCWHGVPRGIPRTRFAVPVFESSAGTRCSEGLLELAVDLPDTLVGAHLASEPHTA